MAGKLRSAWWSQAAARKMVAPLALEVAARRPAEVEGSAAQTALAERWESVPEATPRSESRKPRPQRPPEESLRHRDPHRQECLAGTRRHELEPQEASPPPHEEEAEAADEQVPLVPPPR